MAENTENNESLKESSSAGQGGIKGFWNDRSPVFKYIVLFAACIGSFYLFLWNSQWFHDIVVRGVTVFDSKIASMILNIFGYGTWTEGPRVASDAMTVNVKTGCDGLEAMAMYSSGVIAFTAPLWSKIRGLALGLLFLFCMNIFRVVHLWLTGLYMPRYFEFFHQNFWQIVFILISLLTLAFWINKIQKQQRIEAKLAKQQAEDLSGDNA